VAFAGRPAWTLMCAYDESSLSAATLEAARCSHPFVGGAGDYRANDGFRPRCAPFAGELQPAAGEQTELAFDAETLPLVRDTVRAAARGAGMEPTRGQDLVLAVNELATNSVMHGGGRGTLRLVSHENAVVCEVRDRGHIEALLAGRLRPDAIRFGGRGLWLVNQVCDLVQIRSSPDSGTAVRVRMQLG
jgi:anti-sigma regulatory factor (Ser/Thr protein kinase)